MLSSVSFPSAVEMDTFFDQADAIADIHGAEDTDEGIAQFLMQTRMEQKRNRAAETDAQSRVEPSAKKRRVDHIDETNRSPLPPHNTDGGVPFTMSTGGLSQPMSGEPSHASARSLNDAMPNTDDPAIPHSPAKALRSISDIIGLATKRTARPRSPAPQKPLSKPAPTSPLTRSRTAPSRASSSRAQVHTIASTATAKGKGKESATSTAKSSGKPEKAKSKAKAPQKTDNFELPLAEYATWLQDNYSPAVHGRPFAFQALKDHTVFLAVPTGRQKADKERLIGIKRLGGNIAGVYDHSKVTFVTTTIKAQDARGLAQSMGISKISEVPAHINIVSWEWVVECQNTSKQELPHKCSYHVLHQNRNEPKKRAAKKVEPPPPPAKPRKRKRAADVDSDASEAERLEQEAQRRRPSGQVAADPPENQAGTPMQAPTAVDPLEELFDEAEAELIDERDSQGQMFGAKSESDDGSSDGGKPVKLQKVNKGFACLAPPRAETEESPNQYIIDKLKELKDIYSNKQGEVDHFKVHNLNKVIGDLARLTTKLTTRQEALALNGSADKTADKIMEIVETGDLRRIGFEDTDEYRVCRLFAGIFDVGAKRANQWYRMGLRTLEDVAARKEEIRLTQRQAIGLKYYHDLQDKIPREEAAAIFERIRTTAMSIDGNLNLYIMGSYRRGNETCGDIDLLMTRDPTDGITHAGMLHKLLNALRAKGIITEDLSLPEDDDALESKYMGLCRLGPGEKMRRIDILAIPYDQKGASLIYFTGDDLFNRSLRLLARKKGYSLNQRGLYAGVVRDPKTKLKLAPGVIVASKTEREIFDVLGVPWREPHERRRA